MTINIGDFVQVTDAGYVDVYLDENYRVVEIKNRHVRIIDSAGDEQDIMNEHIKGNHESKYVVGKKYKINFHWFGQTGAVVIVTKIDRDYWGEVIHVTYDNGNTEKFSVSSLVDENTEEYNEETSIVVEKTLKMIKKQTFGEFELLRDFVIGVDVHAYIKFNGDLFSKERLKNVIDNLTKIHKAM